jgi:hypothetical protein
MVYGKDSDSNGGLEGSDSGIGEDGWNAGETDRSRRACDVFPTDGEAGYKEDCKLEVMLDIKVEWTGPCHMRWPPAPTSERVR